MVTLHLKEINYHLVWLSTVDEEMRHSDLGVYVLCGLFGSVVDEGRVVVSLECVIIVLKIVWLSSSGKQDRFAIE